jgi:hypothetical protein
VGIGILERDCGRCRRKMTVDIYRRLVKVYDNNDELIHTYKRISEWGLREDGSIKSPIDYMLDYYHDEENDCPLCNGEEVYIMNQFKQDIKPALMKLKRIWKAINEFKEYVEIHKLKDSKKTLASLLYMVSDFEVSLATDYQELYKGLDKDFVFNSICKGL